MKITGKLILAAAGMLLAALLILGGCDIVPDAPDVTADELGDFEGTVVANETDAETLFGQGMGGFSEGYNDVDTSGETPRSILEGFIRGMGDQLRPQADPRSVEVDVDISDNGTKGTTTILIVDETVQGSDLAAGGTGSMTIENLDLESTYQINLDQGTGNLRAKMVAGGEVTFQDFSVDEGWTINDGKINIGSLVRGTIRVTEESLTLDYRADFNMKIGYSITNDDGTGGKFILNFEYSERTGQPITIDYLALLTGEYVEESLESPSVTLRATLEVYDNNNELQVSVDYDKEDILDIIPYQELFL
jgi:hypothetical protein